MERSGILVSETVNKAGKIVANIWDRVILTSLTCNIIQAYAPICNATEDEIDFYDDLKGAMNFVKHMRSTILWMISMLK